MMWPVLGVVLLSLPPLSLGLTCDDSPSFPCPNLDEDYQLTNETTTHGLQVLFDITNVFLDACLSGQLLPDGFGEDYQTMEDLFQLPNDITANYMEFLKTNIRILVVVVFGLILVVLTPILAVIYCCCCCRNKPTRKRKNDGFISYLFGFFIFLFLVLASLGSVWFFLGNTSTAQGIQGLSKVLREMLYDGQLYINNTRDEFTFLLEDNFDTTVLNFNTQLNKTSDEFTDLIDKVKRNSNLTEIIKSTGLLIDFAIISYDTVFKDLFEVKNDLAKIKTDIDDLKELTGSCSEEICTEISTLLDGTLNVLESINLENIEASDGDLDVESLEMFKNSLGNITDQIDSLGNDFVDQYFGEINTQIIDIQNLLKEQAGNIVDILDNVNIFNTLGEDVDTLEDNISKFYNYFYIGLLVIGSLLVVIMCGMFVALCFGCVGSPGSSGALRSATFYSLAMGVFLSLGILFILLTVIMFSVGALSTKVVCQTLEDPEHSELIDLASRPIENDLKSVFNNMTNTPLPEDFFDVVQFIQGLQEGRPIYPLLKLTYIYNISKLSNWQEEYNITTFINMAKQMIDENIDQVVKYEDTISGESGLGSKIHETTRMMDELLNTKVDWTIILSDNLTDQIGNYTNDLNLILESIPDQPPLQSIKVSLASLLIKMDAFSDKLSQFQVNVKKIFAEYENGEGGYHFNFNEDASDILSNINSLFEYIKIDAKNETLSFFDEQVGALLNIIDEFISYAILYAESDLGRTTPVGRIYTFTSEAFCHRIIDPLNTVWSGMGWTFLLILFPLGVLSHIVRKKISVYKGNDNGQDRVQRSYNNPVNRKGAGATAPLKGNQVAMVDLTSHRLRQPPSTASTRGYKVPDKYKGKGH